LSRRTNYKIGINLNNTNQVLLKPEFLAINTLEVSHESLINDNIILKEVNSYQMKLQKTINLFFSQNHKNLESPYKTGTMKIDYYYTEKKYIFLRA